MLARPLNSFTQAVQMLSRHFAAGAYIAAFEHGPERFDAVSAHLIADVFADRV